MITLARDIFILFYVPIWRDLIGEKNFFSFIEDYSFVSNATHFISFQRNSFLYFRTEIKMRNWLLV